MMLLHGTPLSGNRPRAACRTRCLRQTVYAGLFGPSEEEKAVRRRLDSAELELRSWKEKCAAQSIKLEDTEAELAKFRETEKDYLARLRIAEKETFGYEKALREKDMKFDSYSATAERQIAALADALKRAGGSF